MRKVTIVTECDDHVQEATVSTDRTLKEIKAQVLRGNSVMPCGLCGNREAKVTAVKWKKS